MKKYCYILLSLLFITGCYRSERPVSNGAFQSHVDVQAHAFDFDQIQSTGEIIVATLSGPATYYEYQGRRKGLQYAFIQHFAQNHGLRVRVELAHHEDGLIAQLQSGNADVICYPLSEQVIAAHGLVSAGVRDTLSHTSWAVRSDAPLLRAALNRWAEKGFVVTIRKTEQEETRRQRQVKKKSQAPYLSREKGLISHYDSYFKTAACVVGWDWRLLAAQCYQESGFDPEAVSWAGARGLMQIMPPAAAHLRVRQEQLFIPRENIAAAATYLHELDRKLADISNSSERIKFVLAAYNGGLGHVRDAMALAQKYGSNANQWQSVSPYLLKLSEEKYYRDEVVKYGYMIGSETYQYVNAILARWYNYCTIIHP